MPSSTSSSIVDQHAFVVDRRLSGGIEPGAIPPMSAWWPRAADERRRFSLVASRKPGRSL
jgi:hypothetical protein